ncbi:oligoribonuclease, mitochondrial-like [Anopheles albimanus]|uniref:oligoribonuclease, mitochondrial-like n=1 Tax=Anopheles albimanus TaxID=7167 RepID=UPI0016415E8C|nr:oligoribonuclease, mitochondrial-like [Anopheles albimanus]
MYKLYNLFRLTCLKTVRQYSSTSHKSMETYSSNHIVWIDLEMTGLDVESDRILEIACIITDSELNITAKGPNLILHEPDSVLEGMNEWCKKQHRQTGLVEAVKESRLTLQQAEKDILDFIKQYCPAKTCPMAGNSIYMDRLFISKHMPALNEYLHYRVIDVSTIKELCKRWNNITYSDAPRKRLVHRALDDILESITELTYYKNSFFRSTTL